MGRDSEDIAQPKHTAAVSIHAPAWGATFIADIVSLSKQFQSTRPHGARPEKSGADFVGTSFNPRARMGRDLMHF